MKTYYYYYYEIKYTIFFLNFLAFLFLLISTNESDIKSNMLSSYTNLNIFCLPFEMNTIHVIRKFERQIDKKINEKELKPQLQVRVVKQNI